MPRFTKFSLLEGVARGRSLKKRTVLRTTGWSKTITAGKSPIPRVTAGSFEGIGESLAFEAYSAVKEVGLFRQLRHKAVAIETINS